MIQPKVILLFLLGVAVMLWACRPAHTPESDAAEIVKAVDHNEFDRASAMANAFFSSSAAMKVDSLSIPALCNLSVALTRIDEYTEHSDDNTARALQCYRTAMARDSVSASEYYRSLPADDYRYVAFLRHLLSPITAREAGTIYTVNEMGEDTSIVPSDTLKVP